MSRVIAGNEVITVKTPAFAESVTEGDVRWEKGKMCVGSGVCHTRLDLAHPVCVSFSCRRLGL